MRKWIIFLCAAVSTCAVNLAIGATPTFVESADGKRLVRLDDPALNQSFQEVELESTGKTVCFIHENQILLDIHDAPVMIIDDNAVRHDLAGVRLATFDGANLRHGKDGDVVMNYKHPDLCPTFDADPVYRVNGPEQ